MNISGSGKLKSMLIQFFCGVREIRHANAGFSVNTRQWIREITAELKSDEDDIYMTHIKRILMETMIIHKLIFND
jgi:hypothetical protein